MSHQIPDLMQLHCNLAAAGPSTQLHSVFPPYALPVNAGAAGAGVGGPELSGIVRSLTRCCLIWFSVGCFATSPFDLHTQRKQIQRAQPGSAHHPSSLGAYPQQNDGSASATPRQQQIISFVPTDDNMTWLAGKVNALQLNQLIDHSSVDQLVINRLVQ
jgi:hypothetical protein